MDKADEKTDRRDFLKKALLGTGLALISTDLISKIEVLSEPMFSHILPHMSGCAKGSCTSGICQRGLCENGICPSGAIS